MYEDDDAAVGGEAFDIYSASPAAAPAPARRRVQPPGVIPRVRAGPPGHFQPPDTRPPPPDLRPPPSDSSATSEVEMLRERLRATEAELRRANGDPHGGHAPPSPPRSPPTLPRQRVDHKRHQHHHHPPSTQPPPSSHHNHHHRGGEGFERDAELSGASQTRQRWTEQQHPHHQHPLHRDPQYRDPQHQHPQQQEQQEERGSEAATGGGVKLPAEAAASLIEFLTGLSRERTPWSGDLGDWARYLGSLLPEPQTDPVARAGPQGARTFSHPAVDAERQAVSTNVRSGRAAAGGPAVQPGDAAPRRGGAAPAAPAGDGWDTRTGAAGGAREAGGSSSTQSAVPLGRAAWGGSAGDARGARPCSAGGAADP
eukprot:Hpha_TRINITY_DN16687_c2_g2::TRINITY_DN16687_c2_g2_i3::g.182702::m.182702